MAKADITIEVLKQIRDEVRKTNERLEGVNQRIDGVSERVDGVNDRLERLERRQTETEIRIATELVAVGGAVTSLRDAILEDRQLRAQLGDHEARLIRLERKTG